MYKLCVVVRKDIKMSCGKCCAQVGHAVLECFLRQDDKRLKDDWMSEGAKKIVLQISSVEQLHALNEAAKRAGLTTAVISDAGHTELKPGTITCMGIGPDKEEKIDRVTKDLKPL